MSDEHLKQLQQIAAQIQHGQAEIEKQTEKVLDVLNTAAPDVAETLGAIASNAVLFLDFVDEHNVEVPAEFAHIKDIDGGSIFEKVLEARKERKAVGHGDGQLDCSALWIQAVLQNYRHRLEQKIEESKRVADLN